jgi:phosphonate transport system substrate-binding protein
MKPLRFLTISLLILLFAINSACQSSATPTISPPTEPPPTPEPPPEPTATSIPTSVPTDTPTEPPPPTVAPTLPPLGNEGNPVVWAMPPGQDRALFDAALDQAVEVLRDQTGVAVEAMVVESYSQIVNLLCSGEAHIATLDSFAYILASERGCADAELSAERAGSGSVYEAQILVRNDSGIQSFEDMHGATFCRVNTSSKSGWIVPNLKLRAEGIDPESDFAEIIDTGHHDNVIDGIYNGRCEVGATYVDARVLYANEHPDVLNVVNVLVQTIQIPFEGISFVPDFPADLREAFTEAFWYLETLNAGQIITDLNSWNRFLERHDYLYDPLRELIDAAGVDVESLVP